MEEKTNILLVDDHPENLTALEAALEDLGQNLIKASSAKEALKCLMDRDDEFAVILLDVQMPEMDGFEAANLIRQREKFRSTPIIFLTALNRSDFHVARGYASGAVDYILKPFDADILRAKVSVFVEMAKNTRALQAEILRRQKAEEEIKQLNKDLERRVKERTAHIEALNKRLQQMMREMHDRVRNNLQILTAMVEMQRMDSSRSLPLGSWDRLETHIRVLSLVHDLLTEQIKSDMEATGISTRALLQKVIGLLQQTSGRRRLSSLAEDVMLGPQQGTSLALVVSELCSNALKHGAGEVKVQVILDNSIIEVRVCDDGPGFAADFNPRKEGNVGLHLVEDLTRHDLGGQVSYQGQEGGGACVIVRMPLPS